MNKLLLAATLVGSTAFAQSNVASGRAIVVNQCTYPVYLQAVPAAGEGYDEIVAPALQPGQSWSQAYTGLTGKHDGWSIKLSKTEQISGDNILQFEYTYQPTVNADLVWLDLSAVNGIDNPWRCEGWNISSSEKCLGDGFKQATAYTYSTQDAWGMQPQCPATGDFTVTLCELPEGYSASNCNFGQKTGLAFGSDDPLASILSSVVAPVASAWSSFTQQSSPVVTSAAAAAPTTSSTWTTSTSTTAAPVVPTTPTTTPPAAAHTGGRPPFGNHLVDQNDVDPNSQPAAPTGGPTTYITAGHTVTALEVAWVTEFVTVDTPAPTGAHHKRHAHHGAHEHA